MRIRAWSGSNASYTDKNARLADIHRHSAVALPQEAEKKDKNSSALRKCTMKLRYNRVILKDNV